VWALDEVHFQQHGTRCRMWVPPEDYDPVCLHAPTRKSISYFGAVRLRDGLLVSSRPSGNFDGATCLEFFKKLKRHRRPGKKMLIIIDNARYHHASLHEAWRRNAEPVFKLHFLPPYSPELNPMERVWKLARRRCVHNGYFETLEAVSAALEPTFRLWSRPNLTLTRLCSI
jgi:transposase